MLYINWSYRELAERERELAAISVGGARELERQQAASAAQDATLARAHVANSGRVVAIARELTRAGSWVIVTRERTSGSGAFQGVPAAYHVTLARLARLPGGYAVSEWLAQS